jgi:ribosome recycling factor
MTPTNDGNVIRMRVPELTEERRKEMGKQAAKLGEDAKVALRNIRRDVVKALEKLEKDDGISEDDLAGLTDEVDKMTQNMTKEIDALVTSKQKELMKI